MNKKFSQHWKSSKQRRKQRKYLANAPLHTRNKFVSSNLSKPLRKTYGIRSLTLRKNDEVKILRGKFKGKTGKINNVNLKRLRVTIEGIQNKKKDGTKINVYFHPSNLQITNVGSEDKKRLKRLNKNKKKEKKQETKPEEKK
ncbi:50S ribosomal protein L24 [Candidatus Pacearchaeota archaeon]|nr:50S ribosomal protein L24 [Candidatus Pacearchaeota archaeon]